MTQFKHILSASVYLLLEFSWLLSSDHEFIIKAATDMVHISPSKSASELIGRKIAVYL